MKKRLVISDIYRAKNKSAFFAMHQAVTVLHDFDIEFHILWDDINYRDEWTDKIDSFGFNLVSYTKKQLDEYCLNYGISQDIVDKFPNFWAIYCIIHAHYLKSNNICNYYLIYDDDIILREDLKDFKYCLENEIPCLLYEPLNSNCDKSMANLLFSMYENSLDYYQSINPRLYGFNAGIQGISLDMYEDFLEPEYFNLLLNLFNYKSIKDSEGKEITGPERFLIETQEQSFISIMNIIRSKKIPIILKEEKYFVCPNWGNHPIYGEIDPINEFDGWDVSMKSNIVHFIGHTFLNGIYYGKPKMYHKLVDEYLKKQNII